MADIPEFHILKFRYFLYSLVFSASKLNIFGGQ